MDDEEQHLPYIGDFYDGCSDNFSIHELYNDSHMDNHACVHAHTCNPPGPDLSHTHTCFHVHAKVLSDDKVGCTDTTDSAGQRVEKRPCSLSNREAVRKCRERKKARAASLEDEVVTLRDVNQQLRNNLLEATMSKAASEAEVMSLKCLLADLRGRIEGKIGYFPCQNPVNLNSIDSNPCTVQCNDHAYCGDTTLNGQISSGCQLNEMQCPGNHTSEKGGRPVATASGKTYQPRVAGEEAGASPSKHE